MGRLVSNTSMTADGLCDVGAWFVAEGDHDRAGVEQLAAALSPAQRKTDSRSAASSTGTRGSSRATRSRGSAG